MAINRELTQCEKAWDMDPQWDSFELLMRDNVTQEEKVVHFDLTWYGLFIWQEGNFSCDCNRGDFFYGNNSVGYDCAGKRFTVVKAIFPDGTEEKVD